MRLGPILVVLALAVVIGGAIEAQTGAPTTGRARPRAARTGAGALAAGAPLAQSDPAASAEPTTAAEIGSWGQGSWCWFADPRAVHVVGQYDQTFVGWIDWQGEIKVGAYDAHFGVMRTDMVGQISPDDHSAPAIFVEPDNRLTVFWSGHDGPEMFYRSTLRPEDISAWGPVQRIHARVRGPGGYTYPSPVLLPAEGNKLYLFWRGTDWSADYATRTLSGQWSRARELIRNPGQRPYVKVDSNGSDTIALAYTNGHPRNVNASIYYAAYRDGSLWHANGQRIKRIGTGPIAPGQGDLVYDAAATGVPGWVWDVALDPRDRPVMVYATFPSADHHDYWYAQWTGRRWVSHFLTDGGGTISPGGIEYEYSGGLTLDHGDPSIVYLSREVPGGWEIERWLTPDGGYRWSHTTVVSADGLDNVRPLVPRASDGGSISLLWLRGPTYGSYFDYRTSIAFLK